jgi:AraC-like DNA-binding protein
MHIISLVNKKFTDLNPLDCGREDCAPAHSFGPAAREYYLLHYVAAGRGVLQNARGRHEARKGDIFIIRPGEVTTYTADARDPWRYLWIGFDGALAARLEEIPASVVPLETRLFFEMQEAGGLENTREEFLAGKLFALLSALFEHGKKERYVDKAESFFKTRYMEKITVAAAAAQIGLDRRYFTRLFAAGTGETPQAYLTGIRMEKAKEFLSRGEPVKVVAAMCGYDDPFHFSRAFKKKIGVSPKFYANKNLLT